jgi:Glycosyltransferase family 87
MIGAIGELVGLLGSRRVSRDEPHRLPWWDRYGTALLRLAVALMAAIALLKLGDELHRLLWASGMGAIDLRLRHREVQRWFEGLPVYGLFAPMTAYPPASYAILWPLLGWLDLAPARWLWAATTVAALGGLAWLIVRASGADTPLERTVVALAVLSMYAAGATVGNGQLAVHTLPALVAATALLRQQEGSWRRDLLAAGLFLFALVKPTVSAPFFWLVLFVPYRPRPALLVVLGYLALTLLAASYQDLPPGTLVASAVRAGSVMATESSAAATDYANLNSWLRPLGLGQWVLPAALLALLALGLWIYRHRRVDVWLLLGVAALVARLWTYHRWYDDLLILLPMVALFRIGKRAGQADPVALGAWGLLAINWLLTRAPGGQYLLPPPWNDLYVAVLTLSWIAMLAFLLWYAARTGPGDRFRGRVGTRVRTCEGPSAERTAGAWRPEPVFNAQVGRG